MDSGQWILLIVSNIGNAFRLCRVIINDVLLSDNESCSLEVKLALSCDIFEIGVQGFMSLTLADVSSAISSMIKPSVTHGRLIAVSQSLIDEYSHVFLCCQ